MTPLVLGLGVPELLIILAVLLLLFGGSRLAGLGKSTGRALKEFKEETKGLRSNESDDLRPTAAPTSAPPTATAPPATTVGPTSAPISEAGVVDPRRDPEINDPSQLRKDL